MNDYNKNEIAHKANKAATQAAVHAQKGRHYKNLYDKDSERLENWRAIMSNEAIRKNLIIFLIAVTLEIIFSFRIYQAIFTEPQNQDPSVFLPLMAGLFVAALAALNSYLYGFSNESLKNWMIYNYSIIPGSETPKFEIVEKVDKRAAWNLFKGAALTLVLVGFVFLGSYARLEVAMKLDGDRLSALTILDIIMPVAAIIAEILSGIYMVYLMKYSALKLRLNRHYRKFQFHYKRCVDHSQFAYSLIEEAKQMGLSIAPTQHLKEAAYRVLFLSANKENYLDEIIDFKTKQPEASNGVYKEKNAI